MPNRISIHIGDIYYNWRIVALLPDRITPKLRSRMVLCECLCPNKTRKEFSIAHLREGNITNCGCLQFSQRVEKRKRHNTTPNLEGKRFNKLLVLSFYGYINVGRKKRTVKSLWLCRCECGKEKAIKTNELVSNRAKSCGCELIRKRYERCGKNHPRFKGFREISGNQLRSIRACAQRRNKEYNLTAEFLWNLYLKQKRKCALSGLDIKFGSNLKKEVTASLDRIDSTKNYEPNNVQWVHKDVNKIKSNLPQERLLEVCKLITLHKKLL